APLDGGGAPRCGQDRRRPHGAGRHHPSLAEAPRRHPRAGRARALPRERAGQRPRGRARQGVARRGGGARPRFLRAPAKKSATAGATTVSSPVRAAGGLATLSTDSSLWTRWPMDGVTRRAIALWRIGVLGSRAAI